MEKEATKSEKSSGQTSLQMLQLAINDKGYLNEAIDRLLLFGDDAFGDAFEEMKREAVAHHLKQVVVTHCSRSAGARKI